MGTKWSERQINGNYKEMFASRRWPVRVLQEAARQSWIVFYNEQRSTREQREQSGPTLDDLLNGPEPVKYLKRRVAKDIKTL